MPGKEQKERGQQWEKVIAPDNRSPKRYAERVDIFVVRAVNTKGGIR